MRELTEYEQTLLERRRAGFNQFFEESMPVLADFMRRLGAPDPPLVVEDPARYLPAVDTWMSGQVIEAEDRVWIHVRIGYFIGYLLTQKFGGCWFLNEIPGSRYFARYVGGQFTVIRNQNAMTDPFDIADACLSEPPGRSLSRLLAEIEDKLQKA